LGHGYELNKKKKKKTEALTEKKKKKKKKKLKEHWTRFDYEDHRRT